MLLAGFDMSVSRDAEELASPCEPWLDIGGTQLPAPEVRQIVGRLQVSETYSSLQLYYVGYMYGQATGV